MRFLITHLFTVNTYTFLKKPFGVCHFHKKTKQTLKQHSLQRTDLLLYNGHLIIELAIMLLFIF